MTLEIGFISVFLFCISLFSFFIAWKAYGHSKVHGFDPIGLFVILSFSVIGLFILCNSYYKALPETRAQSELEEKRCIEKIEKDKIPHVIREVDGCKVYAFSNGSKWHYFTRCENSKTVTDTAQEDCRLVGKVNTCKEYFTSIETTTGNNYK